MNNDPNRPTDQNTTDQNTAASVAGVPDLSAAAERIDVGSPAIMLSEVRETAAKRHRRRNAVVGVAAAGTLIVSGAVIANLVDSGPDEIVTTATETDSTDATPDATDASAPTTLVVPEDGQTPTTGATPIPVQVVSVPGESVIDAGLPPDEMQGGAQLLSWNGGFLAVRTVSFAQELPTDLPPEIVAQFPPEVADLFVDGLPGTIDEAIDMLNEAGLYDVVAEIVAGDSAVYDAIYANSPTFETTVRFSPDGVDWSDLDVAFPDPEAPLQQLASTGDRLVVVSDTRTDGVDDGDITIASTDDLVNWTTQSVPLPAPPTDLPDYVQFQSFPTELVASGDRWIVSVSSYTDIDVMALLDPALRERIESGDGYGVGYDDNGVTITLGGPDLVGTTSYEVTTADVETSAGDVVVEGTVAAAPVVTSLVEDVVVEEPLPEEIIEFTWEELGVESPASVIGQEGESVTWVGSFDGEPTRVDSTEQDPSFGSIVAVTNGFAMTTGSDVLLSSDGVTWTPSASLDAAYVESIMPVGDTVVAFTIGEQNGRSLYLLDRDTLTWTELSIDGLPESFSIDRTTAGAATLYEYEDGGAGGDFGRSIGTAEVDGYRFELQVGENHADAFDVSYTLTDIASGEVVVTESADQVNNIEEPFLYATEVYDVNGSEEGIVIVDPETGEELVAIPFFDLDYVFIDADGNEVDIDVASDEAVAEQVNPPYWLLATNGTEWLVEQIPSDTTEGGYGSLVSNGEVIMIADYDGGFVRYEFG